MRGQGSDHGCCSSLQYFLYSVHAFFKNLLRFFNWMVSSSLPNFLFQSYLSLFSKIERQNSEKYIYLLKEDRKKIIIISQTDLKIWKREQLQNFCSNILPTNMTFLRLTVNFSSLQLTDICKKVTSHAKSSAKLIFVVAKLFKARRTPRTVPFPDIKNQTISNEGRRRKTF